MTSDTAPRRGGREQAPLPLFALSALATAAFVTALTEALPAGLLPAMSSGLSVSESAAGQTVTAYAVGIALATIPLTAVTATWRRKHLLLTAVAVFAAANTVTALSSDYVLTMAARFVAGAAGGVTWALLAPYARRMVPPHQSGRALAIAMVGIPLALSLGVPAGTFLGSVLGWRAAFGAITALTVLLLVWIVLSVPNLPGRRQGARPPMLRTAGLPGVIPILFVTFVFVLAHFALYTYIATFLDQIGMSDSTEVVLLTFGVASLAGIWIVGVYVNRWLRALTVASGLLVAVGAALLAVQSSSPLAVYMAATLWGLGWGGLPTLMQAAIGAAAHAASDAAQALWVTVWNVAMAGGGLVGGILLVTLGAAAFPWSVFALMLPVLVTVVLARVHAFPARSTDIRKSP